MKKLFYFSLFVFHFSLCSAQNWQWGKAGIGGGNLTDNLDFSIATDKKGDCIITGITGQAVTIFGTDSLTQAFIVKYDSAGNVLWASAPTLTSNNYSENNMFNTAVATDKLGNIYLTGSFTGGFSFGGTDTIGSNLTSFFIVKYAPNGTVLWVRQPHQSIAEDYVNTIATDNSGNIIVTGTFSDSLSLGSITLFNPIRTSDLFVYKLDSTGNALWGQMAKTPSTTCFAEPTSMCTDVAGNIFVTGYFKTVVFFGSLQLINLNSICGFLVKYSPSGNVMWAKQSYNLTFLNSNVYSFAVCADNEGSAYITGCFYDSVEFGATKLYSATTYSSFLAKYDSVGNAVWAEQTNQAWQTTGLASDAFDNIFLTATNQTNTCVCPPFNESVMTIGNYTMNVIPWATYISTILKFDKNGNGICGSYLTGVGETFPQVTSDSSGKHIFFSGLIIGVDSVYCGKDTIYNPSTTSYGALTARWLDCKAIEGGVQPEPIINSGINVYPNPATNNLFVTLSPNNKESLCQLYTLTGQQVWVSTIAANTSTFEIPVGNLNNGIYFLKLQTGDGSTLVKKVEVVK